MASQLNRSIGIVKATAMVVGTIIGASIFVQPSVITGHVSSANSVFLVWITAGILTFFGALVCAELSSAFPRTGGVYVFLKETYSPSIGFLWGWAMFWTMHSGIIAAIAVIFARYTAHFIPLDSAGVKLVAVSVILILSAINYVGVRHGSILQTVFTFGKIAAILVIILVGFLLGTPATESVGLQPSPVTSIAPTSGLTLNQFSLALVAGLFAFGGWHMVTYVADETVEPQKNIPRALLAGTLIVTACYIAMNAVYLHVLPIDQVISSTKVAADAADAVIGAGGAAIMSGLVIFSTFGALSGIILAGPRVYYSMSKDGLLFKWLGSVHPRFKTPHRAIAIQAIWASILVGTDTYEALFTRVVYTEWIFFALMAAGLFLLRRRTDYSPPFSVWGYPVIPAIFIISSAVIVINQFISDPAESFFGLLLVIIGLPIYFFWNWKKPAKERSVQ